jgi:acyl carrier protein
MSEQSFTKIRKIVAEELNVSEDDVTMDASFQDDLGADSLAQVELIMALEEQFELDSIPDEDAEKIKTVRDAVDYIDTRLG